jgi:hypothetical protein
MGQGGLYFSTGAHIVEAEFVGNNSSLAGKTLYEFPNSRATNMLDLSDRRCGGSSA